MLMVAVLLPAIQGFQHAGLVVADRLSRRVGVCRRQCGVQPMMMADQQNKIRPQMGRRASAHLLFTAALVSLISIENQAFADVEVRCQNHLRKC